MRWLDMLIPFPCRMVVLWDDVLKAGLGGNIGDARAELFRLYPKKERKQRARRRYWYNASLANAPIQEFPIRSPALGANFAMSASSRSMFVKYALLSGLVSQEQLDAAQAAVRQAAGAAGPLVEVGDGELASELIDKGILTPYQVEKIKEGRTKFNLGPYIITDFIGQGGMGQVFKAVHQVLGRESAVKVLPLSKSTPDSINNFTRETRTQAQLDNPNLVRAFDAGRDGDVHYLVTEYVPGTDLRRLVRSLGPLTQQQAASVILQAARGLDYAHKRGLIHRDVKPGNILVTPEGVAKVSDLGLAGFIQEIDSDPRAGKVVGTADYLSPEQIRSPGEITPASDIYSLGCTLYYAVCGKVPFPGGTARDKARRHCEETPWHPRRFNVNLHEEFVDVIADMMEKDRNERIQTAEEVVARLEQWAGDATPIAGSIKSPWKAEVFPAAEEEPKTDLSPADGEGSEYSASSPSQLSQGTSAAAGHETPPFRPNRGPLMAPASPLAPYIILTLCLAVPASMLVGALLTMVVIRFWR